MNTSTPPNTLYRFRSIDAVLDKYQELENQTIYFASPDQLNDPMEGFRDIVWRGDKIVWENFFKHYVFCLNEGFLRLRVFGDSKELSIDDIPFLGRWDQLSTSQAQKLFDEIWHGFHSLPIIRDIIEALSNRSREIRYIELNYYLRVIHFIIRGEMVASWIVHELLSESEMPQPPGESIIHRVLLSVLQSIKVFEHAQTEKELNDVLRPIEALENNQRIIHQLNTSTSSELLRKNNQLIVSDFPNVYLKGIESLLWPKWYTACFMKNYHNSSMWAHYGNQHRGVCLIFEFDKTINSSNSLDLHQLTDNSVKRISFHKISYRDKPGEVDFFRSIGNPPHAALMKLWYTDEEGNRSEIANQFQSGVDSDDWRKRYWDEFLRDITIKSKDWKYEQEYRLILAENLSRLDEEESRTLTYNFNSLKGIIFGINTPDDDKLRIIEIVQKKCEKYKRTDFKSYQAYYSPETGDIRKYEIQLA